MEQGQSRPAGSLSVKAIKRFAAVSTTGDRADLADVPEDAPVWAHATSTRDNCLGQACPDYGDCFVMRARRNALAADVVVINHHLFFADVALRDEGISELLPACNTVIFDEAHQLPETARLFFGESVSSAQLVELARDTRAELRAAGGASPELERLAARLDKAARDLRLACGETAARLAWQQALRIAGFAEAVEALAKALGSLREPLEAQSERSEGIDSCARRAGTALATLARLRETEPADEVRWVGVRRGAIARRRFPRPAFRPADGGPPAGLDLHARRRSRSGRNSAISRASSAWRRRRPAAGRALSISRARRCSTCRKACPPIRTKRRSPMP
jgi:ATP-dependent DNA helicase DinG